jgi:hypothetical protein
MRKTVLILTSFALVFSALTLFTMCKKKDGVYNPKEKISKIYYEVMRYDSTGKVDSSYMEKKELKEIWRWDKKKLMQIESKDRSWSWDFIYKGKQITKIEAADRTINFTYEDKSKLKEIDVLDERERKILTITVKDRSDDKITELAYTATNYGDEKSLKNTTPLSDRLEPVMRIMLGNNVGDVLLSNMASNEKTHKAVTVSNYSVKLTYSGNNVTKALWTTQVDQTLQTLTYTYAYDNKMNPYYRAISLMSYNDQYDIAVGSTLANIFSCSENNIISYEIRQDTTTSLPVKYQYDYKDDFPVKQTKTVEGRYTNADKTKFITHFMYYYEYID